MLKLTLNIQEMFDEMHYFAVNWVEGTTLVQNGSQKGRIFDPGCYDVEQDRP